MKRAHVVLFLVMSIFSFSVTKSGASLVLNPSGLSVYDTVTGNYWYPDIAGTYFGSTFVGGKNVWENKLNSSAYDGKTNWATASIQQVLEMVSNVQHTYSQDPSGGLKDDGPIDIGQFFSVNMTSSNSWHWGHGVWTMYSGWNGVTSDVPSAGEHNSLYLAYYGIGADNGTVPGFPANTESYYLYTLGTVNDLGSGPVGSWLVSASVLPPNPSAVPEPGTILLVCMGAAIAVWMRRRELN